MSKEEDTFKKLRRIPIREIYNLVRKNKFFLASSGMTKPDIDKNCIELLEFHGWTEDDYGEAIQQINNETFEDIIQIAKEFQKSLR
jgi:hypothetical protein